MRTKQVKHLITWNDWPDHEIREILELAAGIKSRRVNYQGYMTNRTLVMLFQKSSTRTRVSFETAMTEMGGHAIYLDWNTTQFKLSHIRYETAYLSRTAAVIMARMRRHSDLLELRAGASVPLINGCCDLYHPCQAMADMLTIYMDRGEVEGARVAYLGAHNNVVNSLMAVCAALGVHLTLVCPVAPPEAIDQTSKARLRERGLLVETLDREAAVKDADYVYTDTWVDMEFFDDPKHREFKEERIRTMMPYQVNAELMSHSRAKILHDMPIHPGYEITEDMVESERSLIFDQAENRLEAQKAIIIRLIEGR